MQSGSRCILKRDRVKLEGTCCVEIGPIDSARSPAGKPKYDPSAPSQVRMVEKDDLCAVIEVACPCGKKTYVRCEYAQKSGPDQAANQPEK